MYTLLKKRILDLNEEDSGVVLVTTITVFLFLFLMISSVAVVGDTVRQRIMLQGAVDRAAYSGAAAQAEIISRVAVLNRALSWSYVQQNKLQMDYISKQWLMASVAVYNTHELFFENLTTNTTCGHPWHRDSLQSAVPWYLFRLDRGYWGSTNPYSAYVFALYAAQRGDDANQLALQYSLTASRGFYVGADGQDRCINIHGTTRNAEQLRQELMGQGFQWGFGDYFECLLGGYSSNTPAFMEYFANMNLTPEAAWTAWLQALATHGFISTSTYSYVDPLEAQIDILRQQIRSANALIADYTDADRNKTRIENAVRASWTADPAWETQRNVDFTIYGDYDYFEPLVNGTCEQIKHLSLAEREALFLRFSESGSDGSNTGAARMSNGADRWWVLNPASGGGNPRGFARQYNSADPLVARFEGRGAIYAPTGNGMCAPTFDTGNMSIVVAADNPAYVKTKWARFSASHTGQSGDASPNPMILKDDFFHKGGIVVGARQPVRNILTAVLNLSGIFSAFDPDGQSDMWCVAAARAGVNTTGQPGVYETTWITDAGLITNPNFRSGGGWNLCNSDWNAVILPVDKIGCGGNDRVWTTPGYDRDEVNRLLAELLNRIANGQSSLEAAAAMLAGQQNSLTQATARRDAYVTNRNNVNSSLDGQIATQQTNKTNAANAKSSWDSTAANYELTQGPSVTATYNYYCAMAQMYPAAAASWYQAANNVLTAYNNTLAGYRQNAANEQMKIDNANAAITNLTAQKTGNNNYYNPLITGENTNITNLNAEITRLNELIGNYNNTQNNNIALYNYYKSVADSFIWGSDILNKIKAQLQPRYGGSTFDDLNYRDNNYLVH